MSFAPKVGVTITTGGYLEPTGAPTPPELAGVVPEVAVVAMAAA